MERLYKKGKRKRPAKRIEILDFLDDGELRSRYAVKRQRLLGSRLVEAEREGEGIASRIRNAKKLADCRNVGFANSSRAINSAMERSALLLGGSSSGRGSSPSS